MSMITSTRQFIDLLKRENELLEIHDEVDPHLELAEIQRHVVAKKGKAILFHNVKGTKFAVATNLYGSEKRIDLAFGKRPEEFIRNAVHLAETLMPPTLGKLWNARHTAYQAIKVGTRFTDHAPLLATHHSPAKLSSLPQIQCWPEDGGAFITLPLVHTQSPTSGKPNLGMYRVQLFNDTECGMHIQIHRGGGFHYHEAETQNQSLPVHIYVGGPPALTLAAILPLPEDVPELLFASLLMGRKLSLSKSAHSPLPFVAEADFCLAGEIPPFERKPEGPFGDHYGYYSLKHDYPFVKVKHLFHRADAIYPATVVGRPPQEDHYLACYLQDLLKPLIHLVMPQVREVWAYEESGVHSLAGAIVKDRYPREAMTTALRILGEGQLSLSKVLMVTDQPCELRNFKSLFTSMLERIDFSSDLFILSNISQDTLDYTGPKVNSGSKMIWLGLGSIKNQLATSFAGEFTDSRFSAPRIFCPGALVVQGSRYEANDNLGSQLTREISVQNWSVVFLVDDSTAATASTEDFIWHIFTRFEPAADVYSQQVSFKRFHPQLKPPVVIDCRMKPWYPSVLVGDKTVADKLEPILRRLSV